MYRSIIIILVFTLLTTGIFAQDASITTRTDTVFPAYWDSALTVSIRIYNPSEEDERNNNAVLLFSRLQKGLTRILLKDSIFVSDLHYQWSDMDGDGQKDLLVYNTSVMQTNRSYHLYLVNQRNGMLTKLHRFERVLNPVFNWKKCVINGFEIYNRKLVMVTYQLDKKGHLFVVTGVW